MRTYISYARPRETECCFRRLQCHEGYRISDWIWHDSICNDFPNAVLYRDRDQRRAESFIGNDVHAASTPVRNLVVRLKGNVQQTPSDLVRQYYQASGCRLSGQAVDKLTLSDCTRKVDAYSALEILVQYIGVVQDGPPGKDVGRPVGELLETSSGDIEVGSIVLLNYTAGTILAISVVLFVVAVFCRAFVVDDTSKVIACMLRERTGQDTSIPTVAMGDGEVRILRSFSKEKQESYVGTVIPDGYEEMMS